MAMMTRAALLGLATGGRSSIGLASLAATADRHSGSALTSRWIAGLAAAGVATELVIDKLPATASRLEPQNTAARLVFGTAAAAVLSHREGGSR
ncbi:MAG: hypothetical protein M3Y42_19800, partial [Actinomycetota bacterium]|nr:hypothetical protein [Actinomycetota bacterium]